MSIAESRRRITFASIIATWFGVGTLPKMPGTWGSLAALPFAWGIVVTGGNWALLAAAVVAFIVGIWASSRVLQSSEIADPPSIVIDEVAAQWLVLAPVASDWRLYGTGFVLFRLADIFKPWPASLIDRKMKGPLGVMLDDTAAAIYAVIGLLAFESWLLQ